VIGAELVVETVERLASGALAPLAQRGELATLAPRLRKEDGRIAWSSPASRLAALVRAMTPWPGAFTELRGEPLRVVEARPLRAAEAPAGDAAPGTILGRTGNGFAVRCGDGGALLLLRVQRPGRRAVGALDFWNGERIEPGDVCDGGLVASEDVGSKVGGRG
jgi:methionyl-tRNA formyltransferase